MRSNHEGEHSVALARWVVPAYKRVMKLHALVLGFITLVTVGCGDDPTTVVVGSGGGSSGQGGNGGAGGGGNASSAGFVLPGTLAPYPLAVTPDGHAWLFSGSYSSMGPGYPGDWLNAQVSKFNAHGTLEFDAMLDADGFHVEPKAIHTDAQGHVFLLGHVLRSADSGQTMDIGGQFANFPFLESAFVAKLDENGKLLWIKVLNKNAGLDANGLPGSITLIDVGTDDADRVYVAANVHGTADFGGGPVTLDDSLVFVLSPEGKHLEDRVVPAKNTAFLKLEVEPSGATWLARSSLYSHSRIERFNEAGVSTMALEWPVCWVDALAFAIDGQGGFFSVEAEDVAEHCASVTMQHVLPSGVAEWMVTDGLYYAVRPTLTRAGTGHAWMSLGLEGTIDLGQSSLTGKTTDDILLAEMDAHGNVSKTETYGGPGVDQVVQMGLDASGARFLTGYFAEQIDFGAGALTNTSGETRAIFLARIAP